MTIRTLLAVLLLLIPASLMAEEGPPPTIAIIIDDMGVNWDNETRLIALEQPLTLAFLPFRQHTETLAEQGHARRHEIMLHAPMANMAQLGLGAGGLEPDMDQDEMGDVLRRSLASVPHARGVNNHMGSLLTAEEQPMEWVMDELANHNVYFVDSRTTAATVAADVAESRQVPVLSRDVFLDHERTPEAIDRQFRQLLAQAERDGTAIAIGHPHDVTVEYLERMLPKLDEKGFAVATVSAVWAMRNGNYPLFAPTNGILKETTTR